MHDLSSLSSGHVDDKFPAYHKYQPPKSRPIVPFMHHIKWDENDNSKCRFAITRDLANSMHCLAFCDENSTKQRSMSQHTTVQTKRAIF